MIAESIAGLSMAVGTGSVGAYAYLNYRERSRIDSIFFAEDASLLASRQSGYRKRLQKQLALAGLSEKNFYEIVLASVLAGASLIGLLYVIDFSPLYEGMIALIAAAIAVMAPLLYLKEQIAARIKRIDADLSVFLDLVIIILEGGGGLNNAIDEVTRQAGSVLCRDLLDESRRFKQELTTYSSEIAYRNLAERTGSDEIATIVGFIRLSEETGIGVKTIFENQSREIKEREILDIERRATTMNIYMVLVVFVFILPAVIAMVGLPMAADALMPGIY